jgi:two-component system CheB/CheR fusion protein
MNQPNTPPPTANDSLSQAVPVDGGAEAAAERRLGVVGIGASAGGLEALERLFAAMPADTGLAFVVVQHLSPDHKSLMVELLSKHTTMRVCRVEDGMVVEANQVFLLPPKKSVVLQGDCFKLVDRPPGHVVPLPVDILFSSLAEVCGDAAVGIVLSGTGSDGMRGVRDIKVAGGVVLVQDEATARPHLLVIFQPQVQGGTTVAPESMDSATQQRLTDVEGELRYTKENLQATIEELETANEELQATNEELLSSNEELQSTNEELQSVNEELHTVNTEYQSKIQELSELNADLDNLLRGTEIGTLFLDENLLIRRFTPAVARLINIIPRDVGRPLEHFSFSIGVEGLLDDIRSTLATGVQHERGAAAADGRRFLVRVLPYLSGHGARGAVVTFMDVTESVREHDRLQAIIDSLPQSVVVLDGRGRITLVNRAWRRFAEENGAGGNPSVGVGADYLRITAATQGEERTLAEQVTAGLTDVLARRAPAFSVEYPCHSPTEQRWFRLTAAPLAEPFDGLVVSHIDVSPSNGRNTPWRSGRPGRLHERHPTPA